MRALNMDETMTMEKEVKALVARGEAYLVKHSVKNHGAMAATFYDTYLCDDGRTFVYEGSMGGCAGYVFCEPN